MQVMKQNKLPEPDEFIIHPFSFDEKTGLVSLNYSFDGQLHFSEIIDFGVRDAALSGDRLKAFERAISYLQIAAGISYYKSLLPRVIRIENIELDEDVLSFFQSFYKDGLGEFAYRNDIDLSGRINFVSDAPPKICQAYPLDLKDRAVVLFGGGKDSIVSTEIVQSMNKAFSLFCVNPVPEMLDGVEAAEAGLIKVRRTLDSALFELNENGAYNGHVPITGILSFIAVAASILHGFDTIVLSNERSASEGNVQKDGQNVNHQYSKSYEFEAMFSKLVQAKVIANIRYFSLIRPMSELQIAKQFSKITRYDPVFTSCNANFKIQGRMDQKKWCGDCPKCRFAFLVLAGPIGKQRALNIFGANLLDDGAQMDGFAELLGLQGHKPWECVGEILESRVALYDLLHEEQWKDAAVVKALGAKLGVFKNDILAAKEHYYTLSKEHGVPPEYMEALRAFVD